MKSGVAKKLKFAGIILIALALIFTIGVAVFVGGTNYIYRIRASYIESIKVELAEGAEVKNTILMIGDGMGPLHLEATKGYFGMDTLFMETMSYNGMVTTFSKTGVTDSAAAATALSTGVKIQNGGVAMDGGKNLETMGELAKKHGKSVGIITTEALYGATPASFSAHAQFRGESDRITKFQLESGFDLFIGATDLSNYASYEYDIRAAGYDYVNEFDDLSYSSDKIFAVFSKISTSNGTNEQPELKDIVRFAINFLESKSDNGYFLMIEGAHIDKRSHSNDIKGMVEQLKAFDEAVNAVMDEASVDTYVLVTADHETGDLRYNGETGDAIKNSLYHSGGHTGKDVRYFATSHVVNLPRRIDNTNVASVFRQLISGSYAA